MCFSMCAILHLYRGLPWSGCFDGQVVLMWSGCFDGRVVLIVIGSVFIVYFAKYTFNDLTFTVPVYVMQC